MARLGAVLLKLALRCCTGPRHSAEPLRPFLSPSGDPQCFVRLISDLDTCRFQAKGRRLATEAHPAKQTKVLVVEDDVMIRTVLADMLCELGFTVAAEAASIDEALEATRKTDFDLAILDADLKGQSVSPIVDALVARDIRFVFVTGYGDHGLPAYRDRPTLRKPFQMDALKRALQERLGTR